MSVLDAGKLILIRYNTAMTSRVIVRMIPVYNLRLALAGCED
jgi:hypothetical protein